MSKEYDVFGMDFEGMSSEFDIKYSIIAYALAILTFIAHLIVLAYSLIYPSVERMAGFISLFIFLISFPLSLVALFGFITLSIRWGSRFFFYCCVLIAALSIIISPIIAAFELYSTLSAVSEPGLLDIASYVLSCLLMGFGGLLFGIGLLKTGKKGIVRIAGALNIIYGIFSLTLFLAFVSFLMAPLLVLLEAYILYAWWKNPQMKKH